MKELLGAFSYLGIHQFASLVFGLARTKIIAAFLGPFGMGIFSQANNLMEMVRQISSLGISDGFLKLVSEFHKHQDQARLGKTIMTALSAFGMIGALLMLIAGVFSTEVSSWIFDDPAYGWFVLIGVLAGLLSVEYLTLLVVYQALLKWAEYALVSVIGYVFNLAIGVVLILSLQLWGAVLSILAAQIVNLLIVVVVLRRNVLPNDFGSLWRYRPDSLSFRVLMRYIGPLSTLTLVAALSSMLIRSSVIHQLGADANGIYQVVYAISLAYMGLVRNAFMAYGMPKITTLLDQPQKIIRIQNDEMRLGLLILCPLTLFTMITRQIWIPLLYSSAFLSAAPLLIWQFIADILRMLRLTMNISLLPMDRLGFVIFDGLVDWIGWMLLSFLLLPSMGIAALPFSYMLVGLVSLVITYFYQRSTTSFRIYPPNIQLSGKAFVLLLPGLFLAHWGQNTILQVIIPSILLMIMLVWMPNLDEYSRLIALVREQLQKLNRKGR